MSRIKLFSLALLLVSFIACSDDEEMMVSGTPLCEVDGLTYTNAISSIINTSCALSGCHASNTTATFPMGNYDETFAAVGFGRIIGAINHEPGFAPMPRNASQLDDCTIDRITAWINDGAPE